MEGVAHTVSFQHSDPRWRVPLEFPAVFVRPHDVRAGDLVYTRRPKGYQRLAAVAGDTWRHISIAAIVAGYPWVLELGPHGYQGRPLTTVVEMYDTVAVQRLASCPNWCSGEFLNAVASQMNKPTAFHGRIELGSIGLLSLGRMAAETGRIANARRILGQWLLSRDGFGERGICTSPIAKNLERLCAHHKVLLDVWTSKANAPRMRSPKTLSGLAMPDDVWRSLQATSEHFWVKKDGSAIRDEIDLTHTREEDPIMTLGV